MACKIAIVDDSRTDREYLALLTRSWADAEGVGCEINTFGSAEAFLFEYAEKRDYDILLLDIEMAKMDGVSLARNVREDNDTVQIVFVTGFSDYVTDGYDVAALHYLLKPISEAKLYEVLRRAVRNLRKNERTLLLELTDKTVRVPFYEIRYLEVRQNYVTVHAKEEYTLKKPLAEFEATLDERFFRTGRSHIVNLHCVRKVTKTDVHLTDGTVLPLPRGGQTALNRAIIERV